VQLSPQMTETGRTHPIKWFPGCQNDHLMIQIMIGGFISVSECSELWESDSTFPVYSDQTVMPNRSHGYLSFLQLLIEDLKLEHKNLYFHFNVNL
jgi:hypothetical protein